jgi:D-alanyl-D-alanine carboxypeptidase
MKNIMCSYDLGAGDVFLFQKQIFWFVGLFLFFAFSYTAQGVAVSARSAVVMEMETGAVLFEKNPDERLAMASTTKIMTAICAIENRNPGDVIEITEEMTNVEGSSIYLKAGERFTLEELLYGLMLESGNDAAVAIAIAVSGDVPSFVDLMNQTAHRLGLLNTAFQNPNGLPAEGHYTTARELAVLSAYACKNELFSAIVATKSKTIGHT